MMQIGVRGVYLVVLCAVATLSPAARAKTGKLVVFIVVDQLRYQDLLWAREQLGRGGFGGLGPPLQARYRAALTHTAPDHATLSTGAYPEVHGVVGNTLLADGKAIEATDDPDCENWRGTRHQGPGKLMVPTVADALKLASLGRARSLAVAFKDRGALFLAGPGADLALFWDYDAGELTSSRCYASGPPGWLSELQRKNPVSGWKDYLWTPSRPEEVYARLAERESASADAYGFGGRFPHRVGREPGKSLFTALRASPPSTTIVLRAAEAGVWGMRLGDRGETDLLLISLSGLDYVGHAYGTASRERLDMLLRMHDGLSGFVSRLRARFGDRVAFVLSADHGATPSSQTVAAAKLPGLRLEFPALASIVVEALDKQFGHHDKWVDLIDDGVLALRRFPDVDPVRAAQAAAAALSKVQGMWRAVAAADMPAQDPVLRRSFHPARSGDVMFVQGPLVTVAGSDIASHGSPWNEDALVPVLFATPGFRLRPVLAGGILDPIQIAPTLALLLGIAPPSAAFAEPFLVGAQK
jgi:predicted AlkP superfamily pyrophosphatase or phosphodiesterase